MCVCVIYYYNNNNYERKYVHVQKIHASPNPSKKKSYLKMSLELLD